MSLFQTHALVETRNLITQAFKLNELGEDADFEPTLAQYGEVMWILAEHYENGEVPFGGEEDVDMAMSICYDKLYVYALGGSLFAH